MSINRGVDKEDVVHIYNGILAIKNEILPFEATWVDLEIIILNELRERQIYITYICNIKIMTQMNLFTK